MIFKGYLSDIDPGSIDASFWEILRPQNDRAGLQERFEVRQDLRPAARDRLDKLGALTLDAVGHGQFHSLANGLDFHDAKRPSLCLEFRPELVAPANTQTLAGLEGDNLAGIAHPAVGINELPRSANLPVGLGVGAAPILPREFLTRKCGPQTLGRRANVSDIDETAAASVSHEVLLPASSSTWTA